MIINGLKEFRGRRVLMLQGPVGPFFSYLAMDLALTGAIVFKVNFNGGDWVFSRGSAFTRVFNYTGTLEGWQSYLSSLLQRLSIDTVLLFGDCRPVHVPAMALVRKLGLKVGVFEEGYLRPDYVTLERDGVNNNSSLPNNPLFYLHQPQRVFPQAAPLGSTYGQAAKWGMIYFAFATLGRFLFSRYQHHRRLGFSDGPSWVVSFCRKHSYERLERPTFRMLLSRASGRFFLVPLQTRGDAQMSIHSDFNSVGEFIEYVMASFSRHAPEDCLLVIKHHPLDRGYSDYRTLIERFKRKYGLDNRCYYIHDQHLPTLLEHTRGVVVVNSTVGLSAVGEGVPVKVCGAAIYDIKGLTFQGALAEFWSSAHQYRPDAVLYRAFKSYLISHTQHQGSFYKRLPGVTYKSGVMWAEHGFDSAHSVEFSGAADQEQAETPGKNGWGRMDKR